MGQISVLVADDSAFMRKIISEMLSSDPEISVAGTARDGADAIAKARTVRPDVITLDVEMPVMDGLSALPVLAGELGIPVVMLSSLTQAGAEVTIRSLSLGAVDFVPKPSGAISLDIEKVRDELLAKVRAAAGVSRSRVRALVREMRTPVGAQGGSGGPGRAGLVGPAGSANGPKSTATSEATALRPGATVAAKEARPRGAKARAVVVIGTSTGGPRALTQVVPFLPPNLPAGVLVIQHMPAGFTKSLADRLNDTSRIKVAEAQGGELITEGEALVAPGGYHMLVKPDGTVALDSSPPMHGVRPAVDMTMNSAVDLFRNKTVGVIMTGMGSDGADAAARVKRLGGKTVIEHESTCVVYGMPRSVVERGDADRIVPLPKIADEIVDAVLSL
ncbi:MAG: chemotaxis response regulator protein-glutamate methylesterase [Clostridia bacterium]|nr:chemotaxis response regulator protein-glutamate methylesterase [Clostridia bacterium]